MKIALVNTMTPYVQGGAEILVDDLRIQLKENGHMAHLYRIPFPDNYEAALMNTIAATRMLRLDGYDRVIAFKFPAYCVEHPNKVMWMFHQFRQVYELDGTEYGLPQSGVAKRIKEVVHAVDNADIPKSRHVYTNAQEVSNRLMKYNSIPSEVLPPPLKNAEHYYCDSTGDYIFYPSRINSLKRQHLMVQAMKHTKSGVKLVIAGQCPEAGYMREMRAFVAENGIEDKVTIMDEWISDERKVELLSKSLAAAYIPYKEDSCGFVTMEAQYASKPVITCIDSGGTVEFVRQGVDGCFVAPDPKDLAAAIDRLYEDKQMAQRMGELGRQSIEEKNITWENTIRRLLA
ncbi:glycosyltransferase family 4 protein [Christensenellaceae bacterium OttesenSCG-928-K19]|nr:glycosyltransferase family 4 protein [Christensenellaceae bacterium OttesenSCG-928-K19]